MYTFSNGSKTLGPGKWLCVGWIDFHPIPDSNNPFCYEAHLYAGSELIGSSRIGTWHTAPSTPSTLTVVGFKKTEAKSTTFKLNPIINGISASTNIACTAIQLG